MKRTPMPRFNRKRRKREWIRAYHSEAFVLWTKSRVSCASGRRGCVCAHISPSIGPPSGMARKADACWVVPLTLDEELEKHQVGQATFEARWGIDLTLEAMDHWAAWEEHEGGLSE